MAIVEAMQGLAELPQEPAQAGQPAQPGELPPNMARALELARQVQAAQAAAQAQDQARAMSRDELREHIRAQVRREVTDEIHRELDGEMRPDQVGALAQQIAEHAAEQAAEAAAMAAGREFVPRRPGQMEARTMQPPRQRDEIPPQAVEMTYAFFAAVVFCVVGLPIARAWARRMDRRAVPAASPEVSSQLRHLQQSVEAIAIEVERISEAQRYTARMLTEGAAQPVEVRQGERVGAP